LAGGDKGEIAHPGPVRARHREAAFEPIGCHGRARLGAGAHHEATLAPGPNAMAPTRPRNAMLAALNPLRAIPARF